LGCAAGRPQTFLTGATGSFITRRPEGADTENIMGQAKITTKTIEKTELQIMETPMLVDPSKVEILVKEIDMESSQSIMKFGSKAQTELQEISQSMLAGVQNKDVGPAGSALTEMITTIKGFDVTRLNRDRTLWDRLLGRAKPIVAFRERYSQVNEQIARISQELMRHEHQLLKDIESLDMLYDKTLGFYENLAFYIAAGEKKIADLDAIDIPAMEARVEEAEEGNKVKVAQDLRNLRAARDDLERRVHDLRLTRQVTMQSLPSIKLVQENDKSLVNKIGSTLNNTVPLWETQMAQAITINQSAEAARAVREAGDLTNALLESNANNLRDANKQIRTEMERGVFDVASIAKANENLIATIDESLQIADQGKAKRAEAEKELRKLEIELRDTLSAAKAKSRDANPVEVI
jgi:uncharacterized protein YaaN involved in tellurite resistance